MTQNATSQKGYFAELVEHLEEFTERQLNMIAASFGAESSSAEDIARRWCDEPEAFLAVLDRKIKSSQAWSLLEEMACEHGHPVEVQWLSKKHRTTLTELGLLKSRRGPDNEWTGVLPAGVAALVAPKLTLTRPSLMIMLGRLPTEDLEALAQRLDVPVTKSRIKLVYALSDRLRQPDTVPELIEQLPDPEWIGAAMMILELGGICFWQEIFGYDLDASLGEEDKIVPLMRSHERTQERSVAETLMDFGIIFRIDDDSTPYPLVAVPEEIWGGLWSLGRGWLMEWTSNAYYQLREQGVRRAQAVEVDDLQCVLKWIVCETDRKTFEVAEREPSEATLRHLVEIGGHDETFWRSCYNVALGSRILKEDESGRAGVGARYHDLLELSRPMFIRQVLRDWCTGATADLADLNLNYAFGLDEDWRAQCLEYLDDNNEFVSQWMRRPGVPSNSTGSGCLRTIDKSGPDMYMIEYGLTNGFVWSVKLVWLDLLSMLETDRWYPLSAITEMFQFVSCFALFTQLGHLLDEPNYAFYLPVQRPSFITDTYHSSQYQLWVRDIVGHLLIPLGVAKLSEDEEWVWLDTRHLRIESPPGWSDRSRADVVADLLDDETLDFRPPNGNRSWMRPVVNHKLLSGQRLDLEGPVEVVRIHARDRKVLKFEGKHLVLDLG